MSAPGQIHHPHPVPYWTDEDEAAYEAASSRIRRSAFGHYRDMKHPPAPVMTSRAKLLETYDNIVTPMPSYKGPRYSPDPLAGKVREKITITEAERRRKVRQKAARDRKKAESKA